MVMSGDLETILPALDIIAVLGALSDYSLEFVDHFNGHLSINSEFQNISAENF